MSNQVVNADLARAIQSKATELDSAMRTTVHAAWELGALLNQAKEQIGHGQLAAYLAETVPQVSVRQAQVYMSLAKRYPIAESITTFTSIKGALTAPKPKTNPSSLLSREPGSWGDRVVELPAEDVAGCGPPQRGPKQRRLDPQRVAKATVQSCEALAIALRIIKDADLQFGADEAFELSESLSNSIEQIERLQQQILANGGCKPKQLKSSPLEDAWSRGRALPPKQLADLIGKLTRDHKRMTGAPAAIGAIGAIGAMMAGMDIGKVRR